MDEAGLLRTVRTASGGEVPPESYVTIDAMGERTTAPVLVSERTDRTSPDVLTLEASALKGGFQLELSRFALVFSGHFDVH